MTISTIKMAMILHEEVYMSRKKMIKKYHVRHNENTYVILDWHELETPIIFDAVYEKDILKYNWWLNASGYAYTTDFYMHRKIAIELARIEGCTSQDLSVDHINEIKVDNRVANLRMATQSEQNHNRKSRCDKEPPAQELLDKGVKELPRYVRWCKHEHKFIIENHPALINDVTLGIRKKACMSGTKSAKFSTIEKYEDILARLDCLNMQHNENGFEKKKNDLYKEYFEIIGCVRRTVTPEKHITTFQDTINTIQPDKKRAQGRKTEVTLPSDCGVTIDMIPKYCYYKKSDDKRGDAFIIDRHPNLDKRYWSTTSSKSVSTYDKYIAMTEMLKKLESINSIINE